MIALDETIVKAKYYVYSAVDVERKLILMKIYPMRDCLAKSFVKELLKYYNPKFVIDRASWLLKSLIWNSSIKPFRKCSSTFSARLNSFALLQPSDVGIHSVSCSCSIIII